MRPVEVTRLKIEDIDFENYTVIIRKDVNLKSKRSRTLPVPNSALKVIIHTNCNLQQNENANAEPPV